MLKSGSIKTGRARKTRRYILVNVALIPFIPLVLAIGVFYYYFTAEISQNTHSSLKRVVEDHRQMIESFLVERKSDLELISNMYSFEELKQKEVMYQAFYNLQRKSNAFIDLGIFNKDGDHVAYQGPYELAGKNYRDSDWFNEVVENGYFVSDVFMGFRNVPHFIIAILKNDGKEEWIIRSTIDTYFFNNMVSMIRMGKTGEAYIVNEEGVIQTHRRSGVDILGKDPEFNQLITPPKKLKTFIVTDRNNEKYLYTTTSLENKKWLLVVRQEKADAYRRLTSATYITLLIFVIGGATIIISAVFMTERILKEIARLQSERTHLGQQLIRATQLAELGEMAAGFAHEINNPLQIIKSEYALIREIMKETEQGDSIHSEENMKDLKESIDQIQVQVDRCSNITHAILKFGRKNPTSKKAIDPKVFIPEIVGMVSQKAAVHGIHIDLSIHEETPSFMGDASQFQQVMLNLMNNAMDAILEKHGPDGGKLGIYSRIKDEQSIEIKISDNGSGISPENLKKIFTPFFTTKPVGKGTGLGLSVCYGIIDNMGGIMEVSSQKNEGTTFVITLPALHEDK